MPIIEPFKTIITPNPLKQGLKLWFGLILWVAGIHYYPKSTKTRIETKRTKKPHQWKYNYYPKSTKTRIETRLDESERSKRFWIITPNPLKQGLKLWYVQCIRKFIIIITPNPLKQGLKLPVEIPYQTTYKPIITPNPLKQGLKPSIPWSLIKLSSIITPNPLKQGLKLLVEIPYQTTYKPLLPQIH